MPSPFAAEVEGRLRATAGGKAEPWNDPADIRREARLRDMEIMRLVSMETAIRLAEAVAGRLPAHQCVMFQHIKDPLAALANLNRSIIQITLAEDRFDESAEERAARIKAEAEARVKAEREAAAERDYTAGQIRRADKKRHVQQAVRAITLDYIHMPYDDREKAYDELFQRLETEDGYDGDAAEIVADVCSRFGIVPKIVPDAEIRTPDGKIDLTARKARLLAFARKYLDLTTPADPADERDQSSLTDPPVSSARAQGPPY